MKLMRKYRVFVCAVLILCFFSFHISRPRQALAIAPAVSLAAAAVLAVGAAAGLSYTFENADAESIAGRLQAFLDDVHPGTSIATYFSARGAAVKDGFMYIGRSLYNRIKEFLQWEVAESNLVPSSTVVLSQTGQYYYTVNDLSLNLTLVENAPNHTVVDGNGAIITTSKSYVVLSSLGSLFPITYGVDSEDYIIIAYSDLCYLKVSLVFDSANNREQVKYYNSIDGGQTWTSAGSNNLSQSILSSNNYFLTFVLYGANLLTPSRMLPAPMTLKLSSDVYSIYAFGNDHLAHLTASAFENSLETGTLTYPSSLSLTASDVISYPDVTDGQSVCVDVGMLTGSTIDEVADEIIDAAIDGTLSPSISAETWTVDVVTTPQELAQDLDQDLTTDVEDNPTVPDTERIEFDPPAHYTVRDLRTFFPFCIPFDLFDMLGVLAAQPVAPHFEYRFQPGIANIDYTIVIDFQQFDSVALLLRRLETLTFCIGLAMVTRNLIRG